MTPTRTVLSRRCFGLIGSFSTWIETLGNVDATLSLFMTTSSGCCGADGAQHSCRVAHYNGVGRHVARDDAPGTDDRALADRHVAKHGGARSDRGALFDYGVFHFPVGGGLQLARSRGGPRVRVVDEHHAMADEDLILDGHAFTDERMARDLAAAADAGVFLDFDEGADFGFVADVAAVEVDELRQFDVLAKLDVRSDAGVIHV